jgi:hypothetical protein
MRGRPATVIADFPEERMSARTGRLILQGMILLAAIIWLAAVALAAPVPQGGAPQRPGPVQGQGQGQGAGGGQQAQKPPQPSPFAGPEDERLAVWAGAWEETVRFAGDAEDKPSGTGKWQARVFYGLFVVINYGMKGPEGNYNAHGIMVFDHELKTYRLWWFDDGANINEYTGKWKDDNTLVFELKRTSQGKVFRERLTYSHVSEDELHTRIDQAFGTEPFKLYLEAVAHRVALPEAPGAGGNQQRQQQQQPQRPRKPPEGD